MLRAAAALPLGALLARCGTDPVAPLGAPADTAAWPIRTLLLAASDVQAQIDDPNLCVVDLSPRAVWKAGHLPHATHQWWQDTLEINNPTYGMLTGAEGRRRIATDIGLQPQGRVVAYDDQGGQHAARLVWLLHVSGFRQAALLDGGAAAWQAIGGDLTTDAESLGGGDLMVQQDEEQLAQGDDIVSRLASGTAPVLLDTRTADEREVTWYDSLRHGQIPGSHWLPRDQWLVDGVVALHPDTLRERLIAAGVPTDASEVIVYGLHGTLACLPWLLLRALGFPHVRVYDGSWAQWGANAEWPIEPLPGA